MRIDFCKMQGLGNDFVVLDATGRRAPRFNPTPAQARFIAERHFGIGCDQILLVEEPTTAAADFRYRIFNADGSEVEQCGNGARCFVRFVHEAGLTDRREIRVETKGGLIGLRLEADGQVTVDMGPPRFVPAEIPFLAEREAVTDPLEVAGRTLEISALSMGNPHAVQVVGDLDRAPLAELGPAIEHHPRFPQRVNASFMQIEDRHAIRLRVWERGAGETLACGTGACAAVVAGIRRGLLDSPVAVAMPGGALTIAWPGINASVMMTGPAVTVFRGTIELPEDLQ
ncbi:MAG: diaminopimelate epimerase [Betaproteobacteria bacterium HGW-Betaproteobacteria-11]|nr:MAG: diaminopimelate epimerase [Betaproteobacteria bacterium HGW-Betaproteobacteria-11]